MIEISLKVMKDCTCSTARDLDGCPRCILAGAGQYDLPNVSRNEAIKYLEAILNHKDQMSALQTGLDSVHVEGFLDSDLEYRFLAILRNLGESGNRIKLERYGIELVEIIKTNDEKKPFEIKLKKKGADQIYHYRIGHQKPLNKGIKHTIADFYFERLDIDNAKPTAVFLDGFKYHAGPQSGDRLAADFVKREALVNGDGVPKHQVWTMTWKDIETFEREASEHPARYFDIECNDQGNFLGQNPVVQFLHVLVGERPEKSFMGLIMNAAKIQKLSASQCSNLAVKGLTEIENVSSLGADIASAISKNPGQDYLIFKSASAPNGQLLITKMGGNRLVSGLHFTSPLAGREQPMFYESWERLLCTFNILQLLSDEMIIRVWAET
jgi:hypothetical protein